MQEQNFHFFGYSVKLDKLINYVTDNVKLYRLNNKKWHSIYDYSSSSSKDRLQ